MSLSRTLWLSASIGLSSLTIGFVAADRLAQAPAPRLAQAAHAASPAPEPETTGTVTQQAEGIEARPPRLVNGFDTERLNALMRGDPLPAPARRR